MNKILLCAISLLVWETLTCSAQTIPVAITNWGNASEDVQLAVTVTNHVIVAGSNTTVVAWIRNRSTNSIGIATAGEEIYNFEVLLVDGSGNEYQVTPNETIRIVSPNLVWLMHAGKTNKFEITMRDWNRFLAPGPYTLKIKKVFFETTDGKPDTDKKHEVISNLVKVQVKSQPPT